MIAAFLRLHNKPTDLFEVFLATVALGWLLLFLAPGDLFSIRYVFDVMLKVFPNWGIFLFLFASFFLPWFGVLKENHGCQLLGMLFNAALWSVVSISMFIGLYSRPGWMTYGIAASFALYTFGKHSHGPR